MDGKSLAKIVALALASTAFAGCIEVPGLLSTSEVEVSAFEHRDLADDAALDWNDKAQLVSVMAFELTQSEADRIEADPEVGNGLAPAWWYVYCAYAQAEDEDEHEDEAARGGADGGSTATATTVPVIRVFKVSADGTVSSEEDASLMASSYEHDMAGTLEAWSVDSAIALRAAKADASFEKVAEGFNASVIEGVASHDGETAWWFAAMSADGFVVATVDAITGELIEVKSLDASFAMPTFEWGARDPETWAAEPILLEGEGYAAPGEEPFEAPLSITGEMHGVLTIDFMSELPTDGLHWAILDSEGELIEADHVRSWMGADTYEHELAIEDAGEYTFTLYYMTWGMPFVPPVGPGGVDYAFTLELMPGEAEHDEDHEG